MNFSISNNIPAKGSFEGIAVEKCDVQTAGAAKTRTSAHLNVSMATDLPALQSAEPTANTPESELRRDDDLGRLVSSAFNLPPPAMPQFTD